MKRPRGPERDKQLEELRPEVPYVRHAWELGRMRRRVEADLRAILAASVHYTMVPLRAGDSRVARAQLDPKLQDKLRAIGSYDEQGLIYGGETRIAHRPFLTETLDAIRNARHALDDAFLQARFSTVLEHLAFKHPPKDAHEDDGLSKDEEWQEAWLQITFGRYSKAVACEAVGINDHAYDERRRRPRAKAGGLSIREEELMTWLREQVDAETQSLTNQREARASVITQNRPLVIAYDPATFSKSFLEKGS